MADHCANNTTAAGACASNDSQDAACFIANDPDDVILSHKIYLFSSLFFVVVGIIGNILSMAVFTNKSMRTMSSNTYLLLLAVSDSMYLISVFFTHSLKTARCLYFPETLMDIMNRSEVLCQLLQFTTDLFSDYSTVLILVFTLERVIAVYLPIRFKELCTVLRARITCLVVFLVPAIAIAPYHFSLMGLYVDANGTSYNYCTVLHGLENQFMIWYIAEAVIFRIVPVFAIAVLNVFIIVRVTKVAREHRRRKAVSKLNKRTKKDEKNVQLTIMLILVSTSYVLVYLPILVLFVLEFLNRNRAVYITEHDMLIAQNYTKTLYVSGFAINFFLYTVSGRVFREQLQTLLCCPKCEHEKNGYAKTTCMETEEITLKTTANS